MTTDLSGGHLVARALGRQASGVFTLCGGHILPIYDGCLAEDIESWTRATSRPAAHAADA